MIRCGNLIEDVLYIYEYLFNYFFPTIQKSHLPPPLPYKINQSPSQPTTSKKNQTKFGTFIHTSTTFIAFTKMTGNNSQIQQEEHF
jgi:hypothetical protein